MQQQTKQQTAEQKLAAALKEVETLKAKVKAQKAAEKKLQKKLENTFVIIDDDCGCGNDNQILTLKQTDLDRFEKWCDNGERGISWMCLTKQQAKPLNLKESLAVMDKKFIREGKFNWRTGEGSDDEVSDDE